MNRGSLLLTEVDTVDPIAVLDANEALDVHLDAEAAAMAQRRAQAAAEADARKGAGRR